MLSITNIAITGANSGDFSQTNNCGSSLGAGATCTINVTFTPSVASAETAALTVTDSVATSPQTTNLSGTGITLAATLSPSSLSLGNQQVTTTSVAQPLTFSNTGQGPVTISSSTLSGANPGDFAQSNNCGSTVAVGGSCTFNVTFSPTATGARSATLAVFDNASGSPQISSLSGTGTTAGGLGAPFAEVQVQNNLDLVNTVTSLTVNITSQPGDLLVAFVREGSSSTDNFTVSDSAGQTWTLTRSGYLNESTTGPRIGMFYMANSAAVTGVTAHYTAGGGVTKPGMIVMEISGAATTTYPSDMLIFATDAASTESSWTAGTGYTIPNNKVLAGASGSNARQAMQFLIVSSTQTNSTTSMTYGSSNWNGNIFAAFKAAPSSPAVGLSPPSLTFAGQIVGTTSTAQALTLSNTGTAPLTISSIALGGTNPSDFGQTNNCPLSP
ncbi:MAG: hypothetical protein DMG21_00910 [Acidobacteria bacterium]|nr:MAG: hypothetical protein DMG21_00910 [Acidobacteriota bacterium]